MRTRHIKTEFWKEMMSDDAPFSAGAIYIYLLTCPEINVSGVFHLPDKAIQANTSISNNELQLAKEWLTAHNKVAFVSNWVYVINADRYNDFHFPGVKETIKKELDSVPPVVFNAFISLISGCRLPELRHAATAASLLKREEESKESKPENAIPPSMSVSRKLSYDEEMERSSLKPGTDIPLEQSEYGPRQFAWYFCHLFKETFSDKFRRPTDKDLETMEALRSELKDNIDMCSFIEWFFEKKAEGLDGNIKSMNILKAMLQEYLDT